MSASARRRTIVLMAGKDLRIEWRSRVVLNQVFPFAAIALVMFAFALDSSNLLERVAPGLVSMTMLFSLALLVQRSFAVESADGALDALRVAGVDPAALFWGKATALTIQLLVLEALLVLTAMLLYGVELHVGGLVLIVASVVLSACGLAAAGTLYGGLTAGFSGRETLLPLLVFPVVAPVLIGSTRAMESAFRIEGAATSEGWPWVGLLAVFVVAFWVGGALAFGPLIEESTQT